MIRKHALQRLEDIAEMWKISVPVLAPHLFHPSPVFSINVGKDESGKRGLRGVYTAITPPPSLIVGREPSSGIVMTMWGR